jgi:thiopeptide-type bacteriocin biosynthesis protein
MLTDAIAPLVRKLREQEMIAGYFFIRYWMSGPHIRLRLSLADGVSEEAVKQIVEQDLSAFLARRPALFEIDKKALGPLYKSMYLAEYSAEKFAEEFGEDGELPFFDNNTFHYIDYEPEYDRYGGEHGMALSERHFEVSSDLVIKLIEDTNMHVRGIVMGHSVQIMLQTCYTFLGNDERVDAFLEQYMDFWQTTFAQNSQNLYPGFDRKYSHMAPKLLKRIAEVQNLNESSECAGTETERNWIAHMKEVREEIRQLVATNSLQMRDGAEGEDAALNILLSSYIHMTNNRLGVSILDEIYLSYLIRRALEKPGVFERAEASGGA